MDLVLEIVLGFFLLESVKLLILVVLIHSLILNEAINRLMLYYVSAELFCLFVVLSSCSLFSSSLYSVRTVPGSSVWATFENKILLLDM